MSNSIQQGTFGLGLEHAWVDYTFGWLDPIGAHTDYRKPEVIDLMLLIAQDEIEFARQEPALR